MNLKSHRKLIIGVSVVVIVFGLFLLSKNKNQKPLSTVSVERGTVVAEVSLTGKVKPEEAIDLMFERAGRIANIAVGVGDAVVAGQIIASLDAGDLFAGVMQAQAALQSQEAKLAQLLVGAKSEDIAVSETAVKNAQQSVADATTALANTQKKIIIDEASTYHDSADDIEGAYTKAVDAVRNQINALFVNPDGDTPQLTFISTDSQSKIESEFRRLQARGILQEWFDMINRIRSGTLSYQVIAPALDATQKNIIQLLSLFDSLENALKNPANISATTISSYKSSVSAGRTLLATALTTINSARDELESQELNSRIAITTAETTLNSAQATLKSAEQALVYKKSGASKEEIEYQKSQIAGALASLTIAQANYNKSFVRSPFGGVVTRIVPVVGDIVSSNSVVGTVIGAGNFQIDTYVAESDIAKIKANDVAKVTLDAYGPDFVLNAIVAKIDLSATILEGVATYKVTLRFTERDARILSGLTANVDIASDKKENVLFVPTRTLVSREGKKFVTVVTGANGGRVQEVEVKVGLRGSDGRTEIISGLNEGNIILAQ